MSAWRVTVRTGPRVQRLRAATLEEALDTLETETRVAATTTRRETVDVRIRRFEPVDQVATRAELRGPGRWRPSVRGGLDVRGDGAVEAWTGRLRREVVEPADGETAYDALRRELRARAGGRPAPYKTSVDP
jgi:hypothetical protein